ncbi:MAG: hypothetical protein ACFB9M_06680 [Myxococcota bacterium]
MEQEGQVGLTWLSCGLFAAVAIGTAPGGPDASARLIRDLTMGRLELPSLQEVQEMVRRRRLRPRSPSAAARRRALLPVVRGRLGTDLDYDVRDATTRTVSEAQAFGADVQVTWDLPSLLFSPYEVAARREAEVARNRERADVQRATELFVERVRLALRLRDSASTELRLQAVRLDGLLSAVTDGAYRLRSRGP